MSYAQITKTASAKRYIEQSEAKERARRDLQRSNILLEASRRWLDEYMARPRRSGMDWTPRFQFKKPETIDGQVISQDYPLLAFQSGGAAEAIARGDHEEGVGDPQGERGQAEASGQAEEARPVDGRGRQGNGSGGIGGFDTPF